MAEKCKETLQMRDRADWGRDLSCGREAVKDGLCKIHLNARDKRAEREAAFKAARDRSDAREQLAGQRRAALRDLGMPGTAIAEYPSFKAGYTGSLILNGDAVDWLIERLQELQDGGA